MAWSQRIGWSLSNVRRRLIGLRRLVVLLVTYALTVAALDLVDVPAPFLLGGVASGALVALRAPSTSPMPKGIRHIGLAIVGVGAGSLMTGSVVQSIAEIPVAVLVSAVATIAISMGAGQLLRLSSAVSQPTALFASIAGAASGVTAMAREMRADEATVASVQYLRVVFVLATVSVVAPLLGGTVDGGTSPAPADAGDLLITGLCVAIGLVIAARLSFGGSRLLIPMTLTMAITLSGALAPVQVPAVVMKIGYAIIGLAVGLSFTKASIVQLRRIAPLVVLQLVLGVVGCTLIGVAFSAVTGTSGLNGYLATTPAGLPAVTAIAIGSDADVGLIVSMQVLRVFVALLTAAAVGALMRRRPKRRPAP